MKRKLLVSHNAQMYNEGKRSHKDYIRRRTEEHLWATITGAGAVAIWSICPPVGIATFITTITLSALDEYIITPRNQPQAVVIEDIECVFPARHQVGMKGGRLVTVEPEFVEALLQLAQEFDVNYIVR